MGKIVCQISILGHQTYRRPTNWKLHWFIIYDYWLFVPSKKAIICWGEILVKLSTWRFQPLGPFNLPKETRHPAQHWPAQRNIGNRPPSACSKLPLRAQPSVNHSWLIESRHSVESVQSKTHVRHVKCSKSSAFQVLGWHFYNWYPCYVPKVCSEISAEFSIVSSGARLERSFQYDYVVFDLSALKK